MGRNTKSPKTINALMKHLRDDHQMEIGGSAQKTKLLEMGYFHGYKGYRYIRKPSNQIAFKNFNELYAIYTFDNELKVLLYPYVMMIETALKNYVLEIIFEDKAIKSAKIEEIFNKVLTAYRNNTNNKNNKKKINKTLMVKRLRLRNSIYKSLSEAYAKNNKITTHFVEGERSIPLWAVFELISLGVFGDFVSCLDNKYEEKISKHFLIDHKFDTDHMAMTEIIYILKSLRNAIAHNSIIFDVRFKDARSGNRVQSIIQKVFPIQINNFEFVSDYFFLIIFLLKGIKIPKTERKKLITDFSSSAEKLRKAIPINVYNQIVPTNFRNTVKSLDGYW